MSKKLHEEALTAAMAAVLRDEFLSEAEDIERAVDAYLRHLAEHGVKLRTEDGADWPGDAP